jgi:hypothetical protein
VNLVRDLACWVFFTSLLAVVIPIAALVAVIDLALEGPQKA